MKQHEKQTNKTSFFNHQTTTFEKNENANELL